MLDTPETGTTADAFRLRVRRLNDAELRTATLSTNDPKSLPSLCAEPPPEEAELVCEMAYLAPYDMKCVFGHRHKTGFIFLDQDNHRYPVGKDCGLKKFGMDWAEVMQAHEAQIVRQNYLLRVDALRAAIQSELPQLRTIRDAAIYATLNQCQRSMVRNAPNLFEACRTATVRDGALSITVRVRDFQAEERAKEKNEKEKHAFGAMSEQERRAYLKKNVIRDRIDPIYKSEPRAAGTIAGWRWFLKSELLATRVENFVDRLEIFLSSSVLTARTADLKAVAMGMEELLSAFQQALDELDAPGQFFEPGNLAMLCNWANQAQIKGHPYSAKGRDLYGSDADGEAVLVAQGLQVEKPDTSPLSRILAATRAAAS